MIVLLKIRTDLIKYLLEVLEVTRYLLQTYI